MPIKDLIHEIENVRNIYALAAFSLVILLILVIYLVNSLSGIFLSEKNLGMLNLVLLALIVLIALIVLTCTMRTMMDKFIQTEDSNNKNMEKIEIVDVDILEGQENINAFKKTWLRDYHSVNINGRFPLIDIKVRNPSDRVAFLKEIMFNTRCIGKLPNPGLRLCVIPSKWDYNILFDPSKDTDCLKLKLAQEVPSNGVDRFVVIVGQKEEYSEYFSFTYEVNMTLYYNNNEAIGLGTFEISIPARHPWDTLNAVTTIYQAQDK